MTTSASAERFEEYVPKSDGTVNALGIVKTYAAGTTTPKATYPTYADALAGTNANATTITLGADGFISFWMQGSYKIDVQTAAGVSISGWPRDNIQGAYLTQGAAANLFADIQKPIPLLFTSGTNSAYVLTPSPAITTYQAGQIFIVELNMTNQVGQIATINVSGKGALQIVDGRFGVNVLPGCMGQGVVGLIVFEGATAPLWYPLNTYSEWVNITGTISASSYDVSDFGTNQLTMMAVTSSGRFVINGAGAVCAGAESIISATSTTLTMARAKSDGSSLTVEQRVLTYSTGAFVSSNQTITSVFVLV